MVILNFHKYKGLFFQKSSYLKSHGWVVMEKLCYFLYFLKEINLSPIKKHLSIDYWIIGNYCFHFTFIISTTLPLSYLYFIIYREVMRLLLRACVVRQEWWMFSYWVSNEQHAITMGDWTTTHVHQCPHVCHDGSHQWGMLISINYSILLPETFNGYK